ncbi:MAG: hypothetical protein LBM59_03235 [Ruminococcus sp.]|jgi:hypothetical protein|nr:hypothetical protein [Ruminococcus sp.]
MDYNILYEAQDAIDFFILSTEQNCYIYKNLTIVHNVNLARRFGNVTAAHRYARGIGISEYRLIGVKNYAEDERRIQKLFFIKPRAKKARDKKSEETNAAGVT